MELQSLRIFLCLGLICSPFTTRARPSALKEVMQYFEEVSKFYRKSGYEAKVAKYIMETAQRNNLQFSTDKIGNVMVSLPGTGSLAGSSKIVALQAHMDMVIAINSKFQHLNGAGDTLLSNGVSMVSENGFVHSKDYATSLGADNGIGMAIMLRLMTHSELVHPPLELLFTVSEEENGLLGAREMKLELHAKEMINLDGFHYGVITNSSMGASRILGSSKWVDLVKLGSDFKFVRISLTGLKGGHSGDDIKKNRVNAAIHLAKLLARIGQSNTPAYLARATAGEINSQSKVPDYYNKIPALFEVEIAVTEKDIPKLLAIIGQSESELKLEAKAGEDLTKIQWVIHTNDADQNAGMISLKAFDEIFDALSIGPNGVLTENSMYKEAIEMSSNLSFFYIEKKENFGRIKMGWMPRSLVNARLEEFQVSLKNHFDSLSAEVEFKVVSTSPAWEANPNSELAKRYAKLAPRNEPYSIENSLGGLEPSFFVQKYPALDVISIGPNIKEAHTPNESVELITVEKLTEDLDKFLQSW